MTSEYFVIRGGRALDGSVRIRGSKNAASKMMLASLLTNKPCVIQNIPFSLEIDIAAELCGRAGSAVTFDREAHACTLHASSITTSQIPELSRRNRIPILAIGPLLHRTGQVEIPFLGGDPIGHRPIDFHLEALNRMGVRIERREHSYYAEADEIRGADITLPFPSVGATENILLTAVCASGRTVIGNAAVEPEVINLINMLTAMGADIHYDAAQRRIEIQGVRNLEGAVARAVPDRNEAVSFVSAALATKGSLNLYETEPAHFTAFLAALEAWGASYTIHSWGLRFKCGLAQRPVSIETAPHPSFMTDWQQPFSVLLTQANGTSRVHETVYEDRFGYAKDLNRMGAVISVSDECLGNTACRFNGQTFNHSARITGPTKLMGADIHITDIRAGMAHVIAALAAEGESLISGVEHLDRGYEKIDERLKELGADIKRISN